MRRAPGTTMLTAMRSALEALAPAMAIEKECQQLSTGDPGKHGMPCVRVYMASTRPLEVGKRMPWQTTPYWATDEARRQAGSGPWHGRRCDRRWGQPCHPAPLSTWPMDAYFRGQPQGVAGRSDRADAGSRACTPRVDQTRLRRMSCHCPLPALGRRQRPMPRTRLFPTPALPHPFYTAQRFGLLRCDVRGVYRPRSRL
jgi:hypothetical protein